MQGLPNVDLMQAQAQNAVNQSQALEQSTSLYGVRKVSEAQITEKAEEFESVFLGQMLQHMFDGIETNEMFGGGHGEDVYKSLMINEYAKVITKTGGIGVADHVKTELLRLQEMASSAA